MKKILYLIMVLLLMVSCRKGEEIATNLNVVTPPTITATAINLSFSGSVNLNDTLLQHIAEFSVIETYSDGSTQTFVPTADLISGWDTSTIGIKPITITKDGLTGTTNINVVNVSVTPVSIILILGEVDVYVGDILQNDLHYFTIKETFSDGSEEIYTPTAEMISGWDTSTEKQVTLTATKDGLTDTLAVNVINAPVTLVSISLAFNEAGVVAWNADINDYTGVSNCNFELQRTYSDGSYDFIYPTSEYFTGWTENLGTDFLDETITVHYEGLTATTVVTFDYRPF